MDTNLYKIADALIERATVLKNETLGKSPKSLTEQMEMLMKLTEAKTLSEVSLAIQKVIM